MIAEIQHMLASLALMCRLLTPHATHKHLRTAVYARYLLPGSMPGLPTTPHVTTFQTMDTQLTNSTRCSVGT